MTNLTVFLWKLDTIDITDIVCNSYMIVNKSSLYCRVSTAKVLKAADGVLEALVVKAGSVHGRRNRRCRRQRTQLIAYIVFYEL